MNKKILFLAVLASGLLIASAFFVFPATIVYAACVGDSISNSQEFLCDGIDNNGNGKIDEGCYSCQGGEYFTIDGQTYCFDFRVMGSASSVNCQQNGGQLASYINTETKNDVLQIISKYGSVVDRQPANVPGYPGYRALYVADSCSALTSRFGTDTSIFIDGGSSSHTIDCSAGTMVHDFYYSDAGRLNDGGSGGSVCEISNCSTPTSNLTLSCSANPSSTNTNQTVTFTPIVSGGTGSYGYSWSGACAGSGVNCSNNFSSTGTYTAYLAVTSGSSTATATCSANVTQSTSNLSVSCVASPNSTNINQSVTFTPIVSGGTGSYGYSWSGACAGSGVNCSNNFSSTGTYTAYLTVTSGSSTAIANCAVNVNQGSNNHSYTQCYSGDVYWYDSSGNRQDLYQSCNSNYNYYNTGSTYCIGNSVYRQGNYNTGGCANGACYNTGNSNAQFVQTCASNQTCQNGVCVNTTNYNDHRGCYGNAVYWFDSYNTRQTLIQTCLYNQICQNGYCVNYINPAPTPVNYKGCYNSDVYWFSPSTNVRLSFYKSCQDNNACTLDSCIGTGVCTNTLKCDGTTCAKGSDSYVTQCTVCGDGVCDQGETLQSCSQDCNVIGLAVTIFGKTESNPVQWTKSFSADANQNVDFLLVVSNGLDTTMNDVSVKADLPSELIYKGGLKVEGNDYAGDIRSGVVLGSLAPRTTRTLTFKVQVVDNNSIFRNEADTLATVTTSAGSSQDTARTTLNKTGTNNNNTTFIPQKGLAGILGLNLSNPLYLFLIIIIIILVLLGIARMIQGFRRD